MKTQDEVVEAAKKAAVRSHRFDQFFWGWCWCSCLDVGLKLAGLQPTEMSPYVCLFFFVANALLALRFQKKVCGVGISFTVTRK